MEFIFTLSLNNLMGRAGQSNYKGINTQAWAAMSLFLQFLRDPNFSHIHLEAQGFEDFNLVFNDGKRIICESKDRKKPFNYAHLKEFLTKVVASKEVADADEILIVCTNVNTELISRVENSRYWDGVKDQFKEKGYSAAMISLLPRVRFWHIKSGFIQKTIYSLFTDLLNFWLSEEDIKRISDSILVQKIYIGSAVGDTYSRIDILKEINNIAVETRQNSVYYNEQLSKREQQFWELERALSNPNHGIWQVPKELSAFSTDYERLKFAKDRLENKHNELVLKNWDPVWKLNRIYAFNFGIFYIFENNLHTDKNRKYILSYIKKYTKMIRGFYRTDYFNVDIVRIVKKIIEGEDGAEYLDDAFIIAKDLIMFNENDFFYLKDTGNEHGEWEKEEICKLARKIYERDTEGNLKQKVIDLIASAFNITQDEGEFIHHAPRDVYEILREWLNEDFEGRFDEFVKMASAQYQKYYEKFKSKMNFKGWEYMGGGISYDSGQYAINERHFVSFILTPAINQYYEKDKAKGWQFIKERCISMPHEVNKYKPDFLNRAVCEIVINRYVNTDENVSNEAFEILKEFILLKKGIPHKSELIYWSAGNIALSDGKKWKLVELTVKKYGIPVNPFVERIVTDLAKNGFLQAKQTMRKWYSNPKYYERFMFDFEVVSGIKTLLETDLKLAVELFTTFIASDYIKKEKSDHFGAYTVASLLNEIIRKDYVAGLSIIRLLENEVKPSEDQQIIYSYALFNHLGNDDSDDEELLLKIYKEVVVPFLKKHGDNVAEISKWLTNASCREAFVQFAARLATKKKIVEALKIIRIFIDDPDPYSLGKDPRDPEDKYSEHKSILEGKESNAIASVRGWCGWVLTKCAVLSGRGQVAEVIELTKKLVNDPNYYVIQMATLPLGQLARNRLTVLPENRELLFLNDDRERALRMSKEIESVAFDLLDKFIAWPPPVQKSLIKSVLHVFDPIRALNEKDSLRFVTAIANLSADIKKEAAPLFIYYAEFRKNKYVNWRFGMPGLYDDLGPEKYDQRKFKTILIETIKEMQKEDPDSCFRFASSVEHALREGSPEEMPKNTELALEYFELLSDIYARNIFNVIYQTMEREFSKPQKDAQKWYQLLIKCFEVEKGFYEKQAEIGNLANVYWYPAQYHSRILELLHDNFGKDKFMEAVKIFFSFPRDLELHESDKLVEIIKQYVATDKDAQDIIKKLRDKNPGKYWTSKPKKRKVTKTHVKKDKKGK
ncbi:MAG: hypothetical protein Q7S57_00715 [bacterium]|nr:hypothetical protein [bacterium]